MSRTIDVEDVRRLKLEPGEVLLFTMPNGTPDKACKDALHQVRDLLTKFGLSWPVLVVAAGIDIAIVSGPDACPANPDGVHSAGCGCDVDPINTNDSCA